MAENEQEKRGQQEQALTAGSSKDNEFEYALITGDDLEGFNREISALLNCGWKALSDARIFFTQAGKLLLVKEMVRLPASSQVSVPVHVGGGMVLPTGRR